MKELSIEQKAQRYDESIERAKGVIEQNPLMEYLKKGIEYILPELKESEDERIKNEITELVMQPTWKTEKEFHRRKELCAWLEKQGQVKESPISQHENKTCKENDDSLTSEDERIRKGLLYVIEHHPSLPEEEAEEYIAWLEKQGEHANFLNKIQVGDEVTRNEDGMLVNLSQLNRVAKKDEKQGEQKPADKVEPKFKVGDKIISTISNIPYYITKVCNGHYLTDVGCIIMFNAQDNFELVEQKPAWSEENELHIKELESLVKQVWAIGEHENDKDTIHKMSELSFFLKTLKPQPKQEWSEEDERHENTIIRAIHGAGNITPIDGELAEKWLKDRVQPQPQWKPSDEQMKVLKILVDTSKGFDHSKILESLYQDLKKLREE